MTARVAVATARYGDPWDELSVLASRLAGALACTADVDVVVPGRDETAVEALWDGACRVVRFPASAVDRRVRAAWRSVVLDEPIDDGRAICACPTDTGPRRRLPALVEEQLVLAEGGDSPALYEHLQATHYDATVFVGLHSPTTYFGLQAVPEGRRVFLVPGAHDATVDLGIHDASLERAERLLVCTETERRRIAGRLEPRHADRVENLGFLLGVNTVVRPDEPGGGEGRFVVVARDWRTPASRCRYGPWAEKLAGRLPDGVALRLVGPGASSLLHGVPYSAARIDAWWWMSRALAVVDPEPHRVVGQEVLESMLLGIPVVVTADGGAIREHAELGNGGLWYRSSEELVASIACLLDGDIARSLGEQGRTYAAARFGDTDTFVKRVAEAFLG